MPPSLEELEAEGSQYQYIVTQATDGSIPFYERMGFVRVGAAVVALHDATDLPIDSMSIARALQISALTYASAAAAVLSDEELMRRARERAAEPERVLDRGFEDEEPFEEERRRQPGGRREGGRRLRAVDVRALGRDVGAARVPVRGDGKVEQQVRPHEVGGTRGAMVGG